MKVKNLDNNIQFLNCGGEMAKLTREKDWSKTSLGTPEYWPQSLRTTLSIILNSKFPMFLFWGEELICFYNDAYRPSLGKEGKHPSILGGKGEEAWPEVWHFLKPMIDKVLSSGEAQLFEDQLAPIYRNGKMEDAYWTYCLSPVNDETGKSAGILSTNTETTEKVKTLNKIKESEKRFRDMVAQAPVAMCVLRGPDYIVEVANEKMLETWGKPAEQMLNKPIFKAMPDVAKQGFEELLNGVFKTGIPFLGNEVPLTLVRNGVPQELYANFVYEPLYEDDKNISGIMVVGIEVTEQINSRKNIEQSEERFRSLAQTLPQLVWITDGQGNPEFRSFRWKEYSGVEPGGEREWKAIVHPDDYEGINAAWSNSLTTGNLYKFVVRLKSKVGEYRWHTVKGEPVLDKENNIVKWVGAFTDIHEQKLIEEKKDEFISVASHEMKTPLTIAKAYLELLELSLDEHNEDANLYTKKASQSVDRINELVSELLDASKIRLGKLNYTLTTFNFNEMIDSTVENIQLISPMHTIIKSGKVHDEVSGDKDRLQQVVINLLANAIKYSPREKKVFIIIEQEKDTIKVSVKDTGIGIAQQSLNKIFDKYHRVEEHGVHFQGLGIGLFISYEIIQRHHGKLWADSEVGKGSTFYFTLPINIPPAVSC